MTDAPSVALSSAPTKASADRIDAYVTALFEVAQAEGGFDAIEDELFQVARAFESHDQLRTTLTDAAIPVERRQGIIEDLLGGRASPLTISLVSFVVGVGRARDLPAIIDRLVARAAENRSELVAEVRSAIPLDDGQIARLAQALGAATDAKVSVKVIVDPSVLGGLVARVGDIVIDGSVRHRLDQLRSATNR